MDVEGIEGGGGARLLLEEAGGGQGLAGGGLLLGEKRAGGGGTQREGKGFTPRVSHPYSKPSQLLKENNLYFTELFQNTREGSFL